MTELEVLQSIETITRSTGNNIDELVRLMTENNELIKTMDSKLIVVVLLLISLYLFDQIRRKKR